MIKIQLYSSISIHNLKPMFKKWLDYSEATAPSPFFLRIIPDIFLP